MKVVDIYKNRDLYMIKDIDTDGSYYYREYREVPLVDRHSFNDLFVIYEDWINELIDKRKLGWLYTIGYRLYFMFDGKRYCYLLPSNTVACREYYVRRLIYRLRIMKCSKFYFHEGRLD